MVRGLEEQVCKNDDKFSLQIRSRTLLASGEERTLVESNYIQSCNLSEVSDRSTAPV